MNLTSPTLCGKPVLLCQNEADHDGECWNPQSGQADQAAQIKVLRKAEIEKPWREGVEKAVELLNRPVTDAHLARDAEAVLRSLL